jgi:hypothetical protein
MEGVLQPTVQYIWMHYWTEINNEQERMWKEGFVPSFKVLADRNVSQEGLRNTTSSITRSTR